MPIGDGLIETFAMHRLGLRNASTEIYLKNLDRLVIKTFEKSSRPRPRPWPPGLETKTKTLATRSRDQDLGHQVSRPRPRPWPPGLETKTKSLVIRSRDQNLIIGHKYLCMCVYMYICLYGCMCVCYIQNVYMYIMYACRCISSQSY